MLHPFFNEDHEDGEERWPSGCVYLLRLGAMCAQPGANCVVRAELYWTSSRVIFTSLLAAIILRTLVPSLLTLLTLLTPSPSSPSSPSSRHWCLSPSCSYYKDILGQRT